MRKRCVAAGFPTPVFSSSSVVFFQLADLPEYLEKCVKADSIILDGEVVLIDHVTHEPLPFGTLGVHKKKQFSAASVGVVRRPVLFFLMLFGAMLILFRFFLIVCV